MIHSDRPSSITADDITRASATDLARLIKAGSLSSRQVIEAHLARITAINSFLNAVVIPLFESARAAADAGDVACENGSTLGPLHGVPITVKEQFLVAGTATTFGLPGRVGHCSPDDGPLVKRLRQAGAIILGKTNISQLLLYHESDNPVYGRTNNPWKRDRTPGGSTGGEAAISAAGGSPLGFGTDLGGSLRVPAHFCGVHAVKPTTHRLTALDTPDGILTMGEAIIPQPGPMARSVADLQLAMEVLTTPRLETTHPDVPLLPMADPRNVRIDHLRVGMYVDDDYFPAAPAIRRAVSEAAEPLRSAGATVEAFNPPNVPQAMRLFYGLLASDGGAWARRALGRDRRDRRVSARLQIGAIPGIPRTPLARAARAAGQRRIADLLVTAHRRSTCEYWQLIEERKRYRARFLAEMDAGKFDAIVCPPHALPALTHGSSYYLSSAASYSMLYNLLDMPAGVVAATRVRIGEETDRPASRDIIERTARVVELGSAGLPVGVQVAARHWREDIVLAVMAVIEERLRDEPDYPLCPPI